MPKTKTDIVARALRDLGVVGAGRDVPSEYRTEAAEALEAEFATANAIQGFGFEFDLNETPDNLFLPLAEMLASRIAASYQVQGPPYSRAIARMRAIVFADDRVDRADTDEDGEISEDELAASKRAEFY